MRIVFSRNRAAQLDLLLRSLERHAPREETIIVWYATTPEYTAGYAKLGLFEWTQPWQFERLILDLIRRAEGLVSFYCDDDVVFRDFSVDPAEAFANSDILCWSWRLFVPGGPWASWEWEPLPRTDAGYPGSVDGHVFRADTLRELLLDESFGNPTYFETLLEKRCEENARRWPLMAAQRYQALVGIPVNRVSEPSGCPYGERFPQTAEMLNARFLDGERISLDAAEQELLANGTSTCHREIRFEWEKA